MEKVIKIAEIDFWPKKISTKKWPENDPKQPKNDPKWPKNDPKLPNDIKMAQNCPKINTS